MRSYGRSDSVTTAGSLILIVDDDHHNLFTLERRLLSHHYRVVTASSGQSAIDTAKEREPDIILLDVQMAEMDGFAVKGALNVDEDTHDIPVIFLSDRAQIEYKTQAFDLEAEDFLPKPFHPEELLARIEVVLRHRIRETQLAEELARLEESIQTGGVELADEAEAIDQLERSIQMADSRKEALSCLHVKVTGLDDMNNPPLTRVILMEVSDILKDMVNPGTDNVTAYQENGSYLLYAVGMTVERATILAEGMRSQIMVRAFSDPAAQEHLKLSIGIRGRASGDDAEPGEVLAGARQAMDQAVEAGGNRVVVHRDGE